MFGIGPQELIIIGIVFLLIFGPSKLSSTARDLGRFANEARRSLDEFKSELTSVSEEVNEARRTVEEFKSELTSADMQKDHRRRRDSRGSRRTAQVTHTEERTDADTGRKGD